MNNQGIGFNKAVNIPPFESGALLLECQDGKWEAMREEDVMG